MNKYQEALQELRENTTCVSDYDEAVDLMEELVDKATPMKPIAHKVKFNSGSYYYRHNCPTCNEKIDDNIQYKYCDCGQALDWSDSE